MKLHELKANTGAKRNRQRVGRGNASKGTYSGRGMNGQNCRSGGGVRIGFEGGQTPLLRRIPKLKGFNNINRKDYIVFNLDFIEKNYAEGEAVSEKTLREKSTLPKNNVLIKILGLGDISKKLTFDGLAMSASTKAKIEKAGGKIENQVITKKVKDLRSKEERKEERRKAYEVKKKANK